MTMKMELPDAINGGMSMQDVPADEAAARGAARIARGVGDDEAIAVGLRTSFLTDGSEVHDISIAGAVFHCVSDLDAEAFLAGFRELVGKHTLEVLRVRYLAG